MLAERILAFCDHIFVFALRGRGHGVRDGEREFQNVGVLKSTYVVGRPLLFLVRFWGSFVAAQA